MAYYYVKAGLTGTGDQGRYASQQTGSFPTGTGGYASISAALAATTSPDNGDFICVSDTHTNTSPGAWASTLTSSTGAPLTIISVDDTACEDYKAGASEEASASGIADFDFTGPHKIMGMTLKPSDLFRQTTSGALMELIDCTISLFSLNTIQHTNDAGLFIFRNCTIDSNSTTDSPISISSGGWYEFYGCNFTAAGGSGLDYVVTGSGFRAGGGSAKFIGCDLSNVDTAILGLHGSDAVNDDMINATFESCQMNASAAFIGETVASRFHQITATNCASSSAAAEYQYHYETRGLDVDDDTAKYRDSSAAFPSGQKVSYKAVTTTATSRNDTAEFEFPAPRYAKLSTAAQDKLRVHLLTSATLTDADVWLELIYPDGTNQHTPNSVYSITNPHDPFRTETALTTNTESWTGWVSENRYQIDVDTSTDAGADCAPTIRVYVAKASTTIYFCSTVEVL